MADWPTSVQYRERLTPTAGMLSVSIPSTRDDAFDWLATINRLAKDDPKLWKATVRQATACDWYMMAMFLSGSQRLDPFTGRPELDCDFQFNYAREMQFDGDRVLDKSARGHWKSTWRNYVGTTNVVVNDPNTVIAIAANIKDAAQRHGYRTMLEWANNIELKTAWDDVFWMDPRTEAPLWSQENGCTVKRTLPATLPTLSWHSIISAPTGSRISLFILDDIEAEGTVESADMRQKTLRRVASFLETAGRAPRIWVNGTHHHSMGVVAHLEISGSFRTRCHKIEDTDQDPPDIAALYDACDGVMPLREEGRHEVMPKALRDIRLDGKPVYLHPLEVAMKRLDAMAVPGGIESYYSQNMGDAHAGQQRRLDKAWIRYYDDDPVDQARGGYGYIVIDPSKGRNDPTFVRLEVTQADRTLSWCGAVRRKLAPSQFGPTILAFCMEWSDVVQIRQIRVEEFGQSTWAYMLRDYFNSRNKWIAPIISCARHNSDNKESTGRQREWMGLEPMYRQGSRFYPSKGMLVEGDDGHAYDVVDYYVKNEYGEFPMPKTDDGLAADYLLAVTKGRAEDGKPLDLTLDYPDNREDQWIAASKRRFADRDVAGNDGSSWMSEGLADAGSEWPM